MSNITIRKIERTDIESVRQIYNYYILHTTATFHIQELTPAEMQELVIFPSSRHQTFVILAEGNDLCGYVYIGPHKKRSAYDSTAEVTLYLKPGYEKKGIGSLALCHIEKYARAQGLHVLVSTICSQNEASLRLFERNGFERCAHYKEVGRKFDQWLDIIACQKILR